MNEPSTVTTWSVDIQLGEHQGHSHAQVRLHTQAPTALTATGRADLSPLDPQDVPEIGFELAAGRALIALGEKLVRTGRDDVDALSESER
jgi:hypothetical protein